MDDKEPVLDPEVQPLSHLECQISDEITEAETDDDLILFDSIPLCSNSFQILKGNFGHILNDEYMKDYNVSLEPMQQLPHLLQDPITEVLVDICRQSPVSFASHGLKNIYDFDMIRQSTSSLCSTEVSFQSPSEKLQPCQEVHEDVNSITTTSNHEVELVKFEHQEIGHVYYDPIAVYMEELFFSEFPLIPKVSVIVHSPRALCCEDQVGNQLCCPCKFYF
jgi:hypothetical protein